MINQLPTNCAPTKGSDQQVGWNNCLENCAKCKQCEPDPNTNCGQMLIASGETDCVPPNCFNQCCKNGSSSEPKTILQKNDFSLDSVVIIFLIVIIVLGIYILSSIFF